MRNRINIFFSAAAATLLFAGCADDMPDNSPKEALELSYIDSLTVGRDATTTYIGVTAREAAWTMTGSEDWCAATPTAGEKGVTRMAVAFTANDAEDAAYRETVFTFRSGSHEKTLVVRQLRTAVLPPNLHDDYPANEEIYAELGKWYYNGEVDAAKTPGDFNQSYDDFYYNYLSHLALNTFDGNTWATGGERYLYSSIERNPRGTDPAAPKLNYGMEFELKTFDNKLVGRILYVEKGSPAETAGLQRGDWFYKVNDTRLGDWATTVPGFQYHYQRFIDTLVHPIRGISPKLGMLAFNGSSETLTDRGRTVTLTPAEFSNSPVLGAQTFRIERLPEGSNNTVNVGYLMYNSFDPKYKNELESAFAEFKKGYQGRPLDNFILDLRYNKSGTVEMAETMGNLLVGDAEGVAGKTFADYVFHDKSYDRPAAFAGHPNGIGVDTVFVLTSPHTAGASELLINALRGLDQQNEVKLVVIGEVTQGMAAGMVSRTIEDPADPTNEYTARIVAFRCYNNAGRNERGGEYIYGFVPNGGVVSEWTSGNNIKWSTSWGWKGQPGSTEDQLVKRAVDFIAGREAIPRAGVINADRRERSGYPRDFCFPTNMTMTVDQPSTIR